MLQLFFDKKNFLSNFYNLTVCMLAVGLCTSKALVSLSATTMFILSLTSLNFINIKEIIKKKKSVLFLIIFFLYYCLSSIWSSNLLVSTQDIVSKLNLIIIPIALLIKPIDSKWLERLFTLFIWAVVGTSVYNFVYYQISPHTIKDIRKLSLFVSHIRFSLFICFSIGLIFKKFFFTTNLWWRLLYFIFFVWLLFYLNASEVLSGILALLGGVLLCCLIGIFRHSKKYRPVYFIGLVLILGSILMIGLYINKHSFNSKFFTDLSHPAFTKLGNVYTHDTLSKEMENGNYIYSFICTKEIDSVWPKISTSPLDQVNVNGYQRRIVLYRYLTSKGLPKDAFGLRNLTKEDLLSIESGVPSILEKKKGIISKIDFYIKNFNLNQNPNGNSVLQRIEYWRVGSSIFFDHLIFGVGIGDYKSSFQKEYIKKSSLLYLENRLETHQQFLSVLIATGCIGGILFALIFYFYILHTSANPLAIYFIGIILASFLVEDTLTTLAGMSFFALFYTLFQTTISSLSGKAEK